MSSLFPKDWNFYSRFCKYTSDLLRGTQEPDDAASEMDVPRSMLNSILATKGLSNQAGENNCFLNSAVQILWHLDVFRKNFNRISNHACVENSCIFCALKVIFTQFTFSDEKVLPPNALRKALAVAFANQQKFQLGLMDDAAECFEHILTRMHFHLSGGDLEDNCTVPHCISHQKFGMMLIEQVVCGCGETSEPLPFVQLVHYVTSHSIINLAEKDKTKSFGNMLRLAHSDGNLRNHCPNNCGSPTRVERTLTNVPDVVSIGLIWDSDNQSTDHVKKLLEAVGTQLRLVELFDSVVDKEQAGAAREHNLVGMVCYYGKHYSAFLLHSKSNCWKSCDDAKVTEIGPKWSDVVEKCTKGRYQPLLLLYQNPRAVLVSLDSVPQQTTVLTSDAPNDGRGTPAADGKRGKEKPPDAKSSDASTSHGNSNSNNSAILAYNGIRFDQGPSVMPSAPPPSFSRPGTKPPSTKPSGGASTKPSEPNVAISRPSVKPTGPSPALPRPSATPSGPSVALPRPSVTPTGPGAALSRPSELARPVHSGSSHSLPRSSESVAKTPSSQMLASSNKTGSHSSIPALQAQHPNPPLHQPLHLNGARVTENALDTLNPPGRSIIPIAGNVAAYPQRYDVLPSRPAYVLYNGGFVAGPRNHLPYQPGIVPPVMSNHGPSFSNNFPGLAAVANASYGLQTLQQPLAPPSGYGQTYNGATVPGAGVIFRATPVPSTSVANKPDDAGRDYRRAGNQSDVLLPNEERLTNDATRPRAPSSEVNLMEWSIIDERALPSPDSDSTSSQYDNLLDFLGVDDKSSCQMTSSANGVPLVARNESLTDSYFVVPEARYLEDMANGKDLTKEADELMEQSEAKENSGDMHAALICSNQATNLYAMARKVPSNCVANDSLGLREQRAISRSRRLLQQIEYNQQKSKSDAKNKSSAVSVTPLQAGTTSATKTIDQDLLIWEDPRRQTQPPKFQAFMDNLPQLYSQNYGGTQYHWASK